MRRGSPCSSVLLWASALASPGVVSAGPAAPPSQTESIAPAAPCQIAVEGPRFMAALDAYRRGDASARAAVLASANALDATCGRSDPRAVAAFYLSLDPASLAEGMALEDEIDTLHGRANSLSTGDVQATRDLRRTLETFIERSEPARDVSARAHALSLDARLGARLLEQQSGPVDGAALHEVTARAALSIELFQRVGQLTPRLDPLWTLARCALLRSDLDAAEDRFLELEEVAEHVGQDAWRERALLGLIGLARERGSLFAAEGLLEELATFRDPGECWSLAREVAVQKISVDDGEGALEWLERFPPSERDGEIDDEALRSKAREDWRSLISAALMRSRQLDLAKKSLPQDGPGAPQPGDAESAAIARLTRATVHLQCGEPARALTLLRELRDVESSSVGRVERLTLEGRALLALGRHGAAIQPLEEALDSAKASPHPALGTGGATRIPCGSRVGEWLGLSAVEALGRAYVANRSPLRAAGLFESVHALNLDRTECTSSIVAIAAASDLGYVTWMVGADRSTAIYVAPDGRATAHSFEIGRRGLERGIQRLRDALVATGQARGRTRGRTRGLGGATADWRGLALELGRTLLPPELVERVQHHGSPGATLTLAPHGVLERLPFEALLLEASGHPLGIETAITIMTALRNPADVAPPLDGPRAHWIALGAPSTREHAPLPGALREIESIDHLHPRWDVVTGDAMTRDALASALGGVRPLHIATHVARIPSDLGRSSVTPFGFVVAEDELLTARELLELRPRLPLVTLTACGSADGMSIDGLSVRGLAQTMLACGTRAAVVTLWPIEDALAERASTRLHAALLAGASPEEATRRARKFLMQLGAPPSEWAAYRLLE